MIGQRTVAAPPTGPAAATDAGLDLARVAVVDAPLRSAAVTAGTPTAAEPEQLLEPKIFATLQARAALAGYELVQLADGEFLIARWGLHRSLEHAAAVEQFLRRIGAA